MKNSIFSYCYIMLLVCLSQQAYSAKSIADMAFHNGIIYTANEQQAYAEAVAIKDGNIIFVGDEKTLEQYIGDQTILTDLQGHLLLPGFIDNHNHVFEAASEIGGDCLLSETASLRHQKKYLKKCKKNSAPGEWLTGWGFSIEYLLDDGVKEIPLEVMDAIFPDRPVVIMEQTSHSMWVNSLALKEVGFSVDTPHPIGGRIIKDETSHSTKNQLYGILYDNAGDIVMEKAWNSLIDKFDQSYTGLISGLEQCAENGITTIGDGRLYWQRGWFDVWQEVDKEDVLTARVVLRPWVYPEVDQKNQLTMFKKMARQNEASSRLLLTQVKMYSDGIIINNTARTISPYLFNRFEGTPNGINYIDQEKMISWLQALDKIGYGAHIHAIGDLGVHESLNAIEKAREKGSKQDYTITHLEMVDEKDIGRFIELDVTADYQFGGEFAMEHDHHWAHQYIGEKKAHNMLPMRQIYDTGANITLSSDWNVNPLSPLAAIANTVALKDRGMPNVLEAIDAYTINVAYSLGLEDVTGSIEVGKSADFVLLDKDITRISPHKIKGATVLMTLLEGESVYDHLDYYSPE